jgi:hypothetical protein
MKQWIKIRKELFCQVETHVKALLGSESPGLKKYQAAYEKEFRVRWREVQRNQLLETLNARRVIGLADFHALQQSQKSHLRILGSLEKKQKRVLAVEFFEARHQQALDRFQQGKLSEREFLKTIRWQKSWGFPWENYRPLVRWAIRHKVRIFGIDQRCSEATAQTLKKRDQFAGQKISELVSKFPDFQVIVIFGDLHWAEAHLPREIVRQSDLARRDIVTVFQNSERIYFQLLERSREVSVDVVKLSKYGFCLLNVPPWVKWQNYLLFLEQKYDRELDEAEADQTDHIGRYVHLIAKELEVDVGIDHFSIYSAESSAFWSEFKDQVRPEDLKWFRSLVANSVSFYIPRTGTGFLAQSSVNHAAQLAMAIVFANISKTENYPAKMPEDFLKLIWLEAVLYFGSKIVNPKRKTDTLVDMKARLAASIPGDQGLEALRLALQQKMSELVFVSHRKRDGRRETFVPRKRVSYREAARLLGGMLGEKLFNAYQKKMISKFTLKELLKKSLESENFKNVYYELVEMIESFPEPFSSKREKL